MNISARFENVQSPALLLVSIGPVQEFIAEARKIRDLWMGSHLLSRMSLELIDVIGRGNIVFPAISSCCGWDSVPNQFFAVVEWSVIDALATGIEDKRRECLTKLAEPIHTELKKTLSIRFGGWDALWHSQLEDHFTLFWVARKVTADDLTTNYKVSYRRLQQQLEERKATRTFKQWKGSTAEKCYQCGHRELLGPADRNQNIQFWQAVLPIASMRGSMKSKERLCAVCLVKRLHTPAGEKKVFDSTSDLAVIPYKRKILECSTSQEVTEYLSGVKALHVEMGRTPITSIDDIDGELFYREGVREKAIIKGFAADMARKTIKTAVDEKVSEDDARYLVEEFIKDAAEAVDQKLSELYKKHGKPSKYLAIMMLDADKMGEYMSGKKLTPPQLLTPDWQREQSEKLGILSNSGYLPIIADWGGMLVYSGGDDLLALGPLQGSLETISRINAAFCLEFPSTTLSGSLVITHHQDSLRWALDEARRSLERAKEEHDRNALVVSLRLSSGTTLTTGAKWQPDKAPLSFYELFTHLTRWLACDDKGLAQSFIFDIQRDFRVFYDALGKLHKGMLDSEVERLLGRHIPKSSPLRDEEDGTGKKIWMAIKESIVELAVSQNRPKYDVQDNFEAFLKIAAFLGRERKGKD